MNSKMHILFVRFSKEKKPLRSLMESGRGGGKTAADPLIKCWKVVLTNDIKPTHNPVKKYSKKPKIKMVQSLLLDEERLPVFSFGIR